MIIKSVDVYSVPFDSEHRDVFFGTSAQFKQFIDDNFLIGSYPGVDYTKDPNGLGTPKNITDDSATIVIRFNVFDTIQKNKSVMNCNYVCIETASGELLYYFITSFETLNNIINENSVVEYSVKFNLKFDVFANYLDVLNQPQQRQFVRRGHVKQYRYDADFSVIDDLQVPTYEIKPMFGEKYQSQVDSIFENQYDILFKVYIFAKADDDTAEVKNGGDTTYFSWNNSEYVYGSDSLEYYFVPVLAYSKFSCTPVNISNLNLVDCEGKVVSWQPFISSSYYPDVKGDGSLVSVKYTFRPPFDWAVDPVDSTTVVINALCNRSISSANINVNSFVAGEIGTCFCCPDINLLKRFNGFRTLADLTQLLDSFFVDYEQTVEGIVVDPLSIVKYNPILRRYPFSFIEVKYGKNEFVPVNTEYVKNNRLIIYYYPTIDGCKYIVKMFHGSGVNFFELVDDTSNMKFVIGGDPLPLTIDTFNSYMRNNANSHNIQYEIADEKAFIGAVSGLTKFAAGLSTGSLGSTLSGATQTASAIQQAEHTKAVLKATEKDLKHATDTTMNLGGGDLDTMYVDRIVLRTNIFNRTENINFNKDIVRDIMYYGFPYNDYSYPFERVSWLYKYIETADSKIVSIRNRLHRNEVEAKLNRGLTIWFIDGYNESSSEPAKNYFKNLNKDVVNVPCDVIV